MKSAAMIGEKALRYIAAQSMANNFFFFFFLMILFFRQQVYAQP